MLLTERERVAEDISGWADNFGRDRSALIPILQEVQKKYGRIFSFSMQMIANILDIHPVEVYGVVSFYSFLHDKPRGRFVIRLCRTVTCEMAGKDRVARQLENDLGIEFGQTTKDGMFTLEWASCLGLCDQGPAIKVNDQVFTKVTPRMVHEIIEGCRGALTAYVTEGVQEKSSSISSNINNDVIFNEVGVDAGLKAVIKQSSTDIINLIEASGLRGRGGAGFPTSMKWKFAAGAKGAEKYVVCNADEGEPGTFKDRVVLMDYPNLVFEGMTIAARAIGATKGIVYLRGEYTYLKGFLESVLSARRELGTLGENILKKDGFNFDIEIRMGAGAYICGEETALIESLEGHRGEPRNRPPFPVDTGFMGCPTVVNNVETLAYVSCIASKGADWFKNNCGTDKSPGLKLFSVSGDCDRPGVYEFPMGITIAELLEEVGGQDAKAVQVGGASGQCVPGDDFGRKIAFEDIATGGSIIVFGQSRDMLAVAKNFLEFFVEESCGQCTPCREGNVKLLEGVEMLEKGQCSMAYLKELCGLGETMQLASKCGLGQSSPNAFLSVVENFQDEILGRTEEVVPV